MGTFTTPDKEKAVQRKPETGDISYWFRNEDKNFFRIRSRMTKKLTRLVAAHFIAKSDFPSIHELPALQPSPFTTFGHQPCLDFKKLQMILWGVIYKIRRETITWARLNPFIYIWILAISVSVYAILRTRTGPSDLPAWMAAGVTIIIGFFIDQKYTSAMINRVARIRATALDELLHDDDIEESGFIKRSQSIESAKDYVGSGEIGEILIPVVICHTEQQPFPGFGRLQLDKSFLCPPKEIGVERTSNLKSLTRNILIHVKSHLVVSGIANINYGELIAINANTIRAESPWLDTEKRPLLYVDRNDIDRMLEMDKEASVLEYFVVEVLFEDSLTCAYFFFRIFKAGISVAAQLAVATLGPPMTSEHAIEKLLFAGRLEAQESMLKKSGFVNAETGRKLKFDIGKFQANLNARLIKSCSIDGLYVLGSRERRKSKKLYHKILDKSVFWPGLSIASPNIREQLSLTFSPDVFARHESLATLKAIYTFISKAMLDALKENGYDVSEYADTSGHYCISTDQFDHLKIGVKVALN